jgi:tRNA-modifying protein YgfZ
MRFPDAQGRILADVHILCREEDFLLDTEPETRQKVYTHLDQFIIADDVTLEDLSGSLTTVALEGPAAGDLLTAAGAPVPQAPYANAPWGNRVVARISYTGTNGFLIFLPSEERAELVSAWAEADLAAAEVLRLENGKPRYSVDITDRYLAQEANQTHALHFSKGCYLGQEIVERVRSRAQLHRRLLPVHFDATEPLAAGTKFESGGKPAGEITSTAYSPALGKVVGLAYVRMDFKPGDSVSAGSVAGQVVNPRADGT